MITRVFRGSSPYGLLRYLYGEGRRNEHTDAHLVASWDGDPAGLEPAADEATRTVSVGRLTHQLEVPVRACETAPEKFVYHLVLRNDSADRVLSDAEWAQVCADAMAATGIAPADDSAGCRWVAVRHDDNHVHVVATLAREDGRAPRLWRDYAALRQVAQNAERRFGLRGTAAGDRTAARRPGVREEVAAERRGKTTPPRTALRRAVRAAAAGSAGPGEFRERLEAAKVRFWPRYSEVDPGQTTGYSVSLDGDTTAGGDPIRYGGGRLAPDLTWPKLTARWDVEPAAAASSGFEEPIRQGSRSDAGATPRVAPVPDSERERLWAETERIVAEAADRIRAETGGGPDAAADAAWAASDTLAAAAAAVEGDAGGPLSDAAERLDRAGRERYSQIPARSDTGQALRSAARLVTMLAAGTGSSAAQFAALLTALAALARAVEELRESQARSHQAAAARDCAGRLSRVAPPPRRDPSRPAGTGASARKSGPQRPKTPVELAREAAGMGFRVRRSKPGAASAGAPPPVRRPDDARGRGRGR